MRLVIDLRAKAFSSFVYLLAKALGNGGGRHEVWVSLDGSDPSMAKMKALVKETPQICLGEYRTGEDQPGSPWCAKSSQIIRDYAQSELSPDVIFRLFVPGDVLMDRRENGPCQAVLLTQLSGLNEQHSAQLASADIILVSSSIQLIKAKEILPALADRIVQVQFGTDESSYPVNTKALLKRSIAGPFLLAFAASRSEMGIDRLLAIYAALPKRLREIYQLVILHADGDSESLAFWQGVLRELGTEPGNVVWVNEIDAREETNLVQACHLYVPINSQNDIFDPVRVQLGTSGKIFEGLADSEDDCLAIDRLIEQLDGKKNHSELIPDPAKDAAGKSWNACAENLWSKLDDVLSRKRSTAKAPAKRRPRLALVSPFPPERTGIAVYSAELAPELAEYYDVELVIKQPELAPDLGAQFPVRDWAWFDKHADHYDRVVYQLGNSRFHWYMWELLERHPGVVVLHDFFVGNALGEWEISGQKPQILAQSLYLSHGYGPLIKRKNQANPYEIILDYPANFPLLKMADGVIVHSEVSLNFANEWYGAGTSANWAEIPLIRKPSPGFERSASREKLGLGPNDFVVCSFGSLSTYKMSRELAEAWNSSELARDKTCHLFFVGDNGGGFQCPGERIQITGYADQEMYRGYLAAADLAVQLRTKSRGETSAAVLDCLLQGIPTIVNANGSMAELPDDVVRKLPDSFELRELATALNDLHSNAALRAELALRAKNYMAIEHSPQLVGKKYFDAIEAFHRQSWHHRKAEAELKLVQASHGCLQTKAQFMEAKQALVAGSRRMRQKQILVDVAAVAENDIKTGIQRVVRAITLELITHPPAGFRIEPVILTRTGMNYARDFTCKLIGIELFLDDDPVDIFPGDIFVGLDLNGNVTASNKFISRIREHGAEIYFCIFDILPVLRRDCFPVDVSNWFRNWLHTVAKVADGLFCISKAVASETHEWLTLSPPARETDLPIGYFHLGANFQQSAPTLGGEDAVLEVEKFRAGRQLFLMVSTLEPRKGYAQALAAFEYLWGLGNDCVLVIIGKPGWKKGGVVDDLRNHPERGKRLLWMEKASDQVLEKVYQMASALVFASEGEGFGLPLIEAARYGVPIISRDIPVFRELAGESAFYFKGLQPTDLADAISAWQQLKREGSVPDSRQIQYIDWQESARQLCKVLLEKQWYKTWK